MRKKIVTPTSSRAANGPNHVPSFEPLRNDVWVSRTHSTAIARSESSRGKRGCPGGGATTAGVDGSPPSRAGAAAASSDEVAGSVSIDADGGTRTPKGIAHRVLSAARLPVPPHPRDFCLAILGGGGPYGGGDLPGAGGHLRGGALDLLEGVVGLDGHHEAVEAVAGVQPAELLDPVLGRSLQPLA